MKLRTGISILIACATVAGASVAGTEKRNFSTSFDELAPYANVETLGRRLMHGLVYRNLVENSEQNNIRLSAFTINPTKEEWKIHIPTQPDPNGKYGLLIWLSSDDDPEITADMEDALDATHTAIITPVGAGKGREIIERRSAMALHGLNWFVHHYPVNPARLMIGGRGEAATLALRLASGYPDIFGGAIAFDADTEFGSGEFPVPAAQLLTMFRNQTDVIFVSTNAGMKNAAATSDSFKQLCVGGTHLQSVSSSFEDVLGEEIRRSITRIDETGKFRLEGKCLATAHQHARSLLESFDSNFKNNKFRQALNDLVNAHLAFGGMIEADVNARWSSIQSYMKEQNMDANELISNSRAAPVYKVEDPFKGTSVTGRNAN